MPGENGAVCVPGGGTEGLIIIYFLIKRSPFFHRSYLPCAFHSCIYRESQFKAFRTSLAAPVAQIKREVQLSSIFISLGKSNVTLHFTFTLHSFTSPVLPELGKQILNLSYYYFLFFIYTTAASRGPVAKRKLPTYLYVNLK